MRMIWKSELVAASRNLLASLFLDWLGRTNKYELEKEAFALEWSCHWLINTAHETDHEFFLFMLRVR